MRCNIQIVATKEITMQSFPLVASKIIARRRTMLPSCLIRWWSSRVSSVPVIYEITPTTDAADLLPQEYGFMRVNTLNEIKARYANTSAAFCQSPCAKRRWTVEIYRCHRVHYREAKDERVRFRCYQQNIELTIAIFRRAKKCELNELHSN